MIIRFITFGDRIELCHSYLSVEEVCYDIEEVCDMTGCHFNRNDGIITYKNDKSELYKFLHMFSGWYDLEL